MFFYQSFSFSNIIYNPFQVILFSLDEFVSVNRRNYHLYLQGLGNLPGVQLMIYDEDERNNYQYIVLELDETVIHVNQEQMIKVLHAENVLARRYFFPGCHNMEPYRSYYPNAGILLPNTENLSKRIILLPTGISISPKEISIICQIIRLVIKNGLEIKERCLV